MSLVTGLSFPVLLLNQRWSPPLRPQASHCSTFRIMCDVPSIAVFCSESIECFPGSASKFLLKLLITTIVIIIIIIIIVVVVVVVVVIIIIIIIIILIITFMQGIYNCIPETNRISRVCVWMYVYIYIYIYIYILYIYIYTYTHTHTHTHIYIYIYTHTHTHMQTGAQLF